MSTFPKKWNIFSQNDGGGRVVWKIYKNYPTFIDKWLLRNYHEGPVDGRVLMRRKKILEAGRRGKERRLGSRDRRGIGAWQTRRRKRRR